MLFDGTSLIPNIGIHTQKIPPITSVNDKRVNSAAWIVLEPIEYKIKPTHTRVPCIENKPWFKLVDIRLLSVSTKIIIDIIAQNNPANATVVNLEYFSHLDMKKLKNQSQKLYQKLNQIAPTEKLPKLL